MARLLVLVPAAGSIILNQLTHRYSFRAGWPRWLAFIDLDEFLSRPDPRRLRAPAASGAVRPPPLACSRFAERSSFASTRARNAMDGRLHHAEHRADYTLSSSPLARRRFPSARIADWSNVSHVHLVERAVPRGLYWRMTSTWRGSPIHRRRSAASVHTESEPTHRRGMSAQRYKPTAPGSPYQPARSPSATQAMPGRSRQACALNSVRLTSTVAGVSSWGPAVHGSHTGRRPSFSGVAAFMDREAITRRLRLLGLSRRRRPTSRGAGQKRCVAKADKAIVGDGERGPKLLNQPVLGSEVGVCGRDGL